MRQHNKCLLEHIGYMFLSVNRSSFCWRPDDDLLTGSKHVAYMLTYISEFIIYLNPHPRTGTANTIRISPKQNLSKKLGKIKGNWTQSPNLNQLRRTLHLFLQNKGTEVFAKLRLLACTSFRIWQWNNLFWRFADRARNRITQLSIPTHEQLQCHRLKFIKNHLKKLLHVSVYDHLQGVTMSSLKSLLFSPH